jgi:hypothetical protein
MHIIILILCLYNVTRSYLLLTIFTKLTMSDTTVLPSSETIIINVTILTTTQTGSIFAVASPLHALLWFETIAACFA